MKLFVWNNPYQVVFGGSIIYAVAETVDGAREQAMKAPLAMYGSNRQIVNEGSDWSHRFTLGEPDRIVDLPCAEIYEWSE